MKTRQKNLTAIDAFEKRRKFPRLKTNLPVMITGPGGNKFKGILNDISPDGTQVRFHKKNRFNVENDNKSPVEKIKSMKCVLLFDLTYSENIFQVRLAAYPVYMNHLDDQTIAAGMIFSEEDLAENKKVSDFLFYQLALSFTDTDSQTGEKVEKKPEATEKENIKEVKKLRIKTVEKSNIPLELSELVLSIDHSHTDLELLKVLLFRVLGSLQTIQETARHIDERLRALEQKSSR
jgi:hypothetical protein